MFDLQKTLSDLAGMAVVAVGLLAFAHAPLPEAAPAGALPEAPELTVSLSPPEEAPKPQEPEQKTEQTPEPPQPEQPPPEEQAMQDPLPDDLPPPLVAPDDPDALPPEPKKATPPPISEEAVAKFKSCLAKYVVLPPKIGRAPRPFGSVQVLVVFEKGTIQRAEAEGTSGNLVLDNWGVRNVLRSKCKALAENGSVVVTLEYPAEKRK